MPLGGQPSWPSALWPRLAACCCAEEQDTHKHEKREIQPRISLQCQFCFYFFWYFLSLFCWVQGDWRWCVPTSCLREQKNNPFTRREIILAATDRPGLLCMNTTGALGTHTHTRTHRCCNTTTRTNVSLHKWFSKMDFEDMMRSAEPAGFAALQSCRVCWAQVAIMEMKWRLTAGLRWSKEPFFYALIWSRSEPWQRLPPLDERLFCLLIGISFFVVFC